MTTRTRHRTVLSGLLATVTATTLAMSMAEPASAQPTPAPPTPATTSSDAKSGAKSGTRSEAVDPAPSEPAAAPGGTTAARAAAAAAADEPTEMEDKVLAAREIGIEPPPEWLGQSDRNFVFLIWQHSANYPVVRAAAELTLSADIKIVDAVCKEFILHGIFEAKVADDTKKISDELAARQARELKRSAYAAAGVALDTEGRLLLYSERDVIVEIWRKATGPKVKAAANTAIDGDAAAQHEFLVSGVVAAADEDLRDAIAEAEKESLEEAARIKRRGEMIAAAALIGVVADEGKLAMTDDNFIRWIWELVDANPRQVEIRAAALGALRSSEPGVWRAFIASGMADANEKDTTRERLAAEAADRASALKIKNDAAANGKDNLVTAATHALLGNDPAAVSHFLLAGRNQVAPDADNRPGAMSWQWRNLNSDKCLATEAGSLASGAVLVQADCAEDNKQRWTAVRVYNSNPARYRIINAQDRAKCVGLETDTAANGTRFTVATCKNAEDEFFTYTKVSDSYVWTNVLAQRAITVLNASKVTGAQTITYDVNNGANQQWYPTNTRLLPGQELGEAKLIQSLVGHTARMQSDGNFVISKGGRAIWATATTNGVRFINQRDGNLVVRRADGTAVWASGTHTSGPSTLFIQDDGHVVLYSNSDGSVTWKSNIWDLSFVSRLNQKCITVPGTTFDAGLQLEMQPCDKRPAQQWMHRDDVLSFNNKCMDVKGGGLAPNGTIVQTWTCHNGPSQKFVLQGDGTLKNPASGKCVDIPNSNRNDGAKLNIWTCGTGLNQKWDRGFV
ncbi:RICIN domain-containing protein [Actinoplanes sp. NPDC023936]|uniref:RICIN domain-containing protein n=1 Tax=Actinoplanes sp. NPDC023936 TaxID=3154910 RepID=UPI0033F1B4AA